MTLYESKEILQSEGIAPEKKGNFDSFLKEIGNKSFQEKNFHFSRYDNLYRLNEILKERKNWPTANFNQESDAFSLMDKNESSFQEQSSPLKVVAPAMRRDSLESHEKEISEGDSENSQN